LIHVGIPDLKGRKEIFKIHTKNMKLDNVNNDKIVEKMKDFSGAEIHATCTEAGYFAIRKNRISVTEKDLKDAIKKVKLEEQLEGEDYLHMFG